MSNRLITRALISVYHKTGLTELVSELAKHKVEIISTGGTYKHIAAAGVPVTEISSYTGFPEMFDGRLKTIHPKVAGGLLYIRTNYWHVKAAEKHEIKPIDLVVVNFYDFMAAVNKEGATFESILELVDIGGPSMTRAAGKNFKDVTVVTDPADYSAIVSELQERDGCISYETRFRLMVKMFEYTSKYDAMVHSYMSSLPGPPPIT